MRFLADEHIPARLIAYLRFHGHHVIAASDPPLAGEPDTTVFRVAKQRRAVIITLDLDFANIQAYPPRTHHGIVVIRTGSQSARIATEAFVRFLHSRAVRYLPGSLVIVEETRTRIRRA